MCAHMRTQTDVHDCSVVAFLPSCQPVTLDYNSSSAYNKQANKNIVNFKWMT